MQVPRGSEQVHKHDLEAGDGLQPDITSMPAVIILHLLGGAVQSG